MPGRRRARGPHAWPGDKIGDRRRKPVARYAAVLQNALPRPIRSTWRELMSRSVKRKEHPLSMRLPVADIAMIDRAAMLHGRSRTEFVRDAAVRAAEDVLMQAAPIRMSPAGFKAFIAALSGPATAVPEMVELFRRTAPWESDESSGRAGAVLRRKNPPKQSRGSNVGS